MKKISAIIGLFLVSISNLQAQNKKQIGRSDACPHVYLGFSTGVNNSVGILGVQAEAAFISAFSLDAGIGVSSWGWKYYAEPRFYLSPCNRGWAFGAGVTHSTGLTGFRTKMETVSGDQYVTLNLYPVTNLMLNAYRFWTLGHRNNKFYLQLGWSVPLTDVKYVQVSNYNNQFTLTSNSDKTIKFIAPGGLIAAFGLSFAIAN